MHLIKMKFIISSGQGLIFEPNPIFLLRLPFIIFYQIGITETSLGQGDDRVNLL